MVANAVVTTQYLIDTQIAYLASFSIGFIGCLVILFFELKHRQSLKSEERRDHKWSLIWSLSVIISCIITQISFVGYALPTVCKYVTGLAMCAYFHRALFLGLFQIQRLRKLFARKHANDKSIYVVRALYSGVLLSPLVIMSIVFNMSVTDYDQYGCRWSDAHSTASSILNLSLLALFLCWNGAILVVYIYKLRQYRQMVQTMMASSENSSKKTIKLLTAIQSALSKILLLTLIYEFFGSIIAVMAFVLQRLSGEGSSYLGIADGIVSAFDVFVSALAVYLMQMHNEKNYVSFLAWANGLYLTCCCQKLARDSDEKQLCNMNDSSQLSPISDPESIQSTPISNSKT